VNREGQVWLYRFFVGFGPRVCLVLGSEVGPDTSCHTLLNLDFPARPDMVGATDFAFEGHLNRHWERVA